MTKKRNFIGTRSRSGVKSVPVQNKNDANMSDMSQYVGQATTIEQGLTLFVRAKETEQVRPATIRNYLNHIGYLSDYLTQTRGYINPLLSDLSAQLIRDYVHYMLYERVRYSSVDGRQDKTVGLSPHTVNIRIRTLRTMAKFWAAEGLIERNFMDNINNVRTDEPESIRGLTDAEIDIVLDSYDTTQYAEYRDKVLTYLLIDTGLRIGEAVGLTLSRVDFQLLTVQVPSQVAKNRRNREVPISQEVGKMLKELHEETVGYFGESDAIFYNAYGEPYAADAFRKRLNRRKARLGMKRLSPHMFRHTFGRNFLLNGGDIATLQRILDHATIETTRKYATVDNADIKAQHNRFSPLRRVLKRK